MADQPNHDWAAACARACIVAAIWALVDAVVFVAIRWWWMAALQAVAGAALLLFAKGGLAAEARGHVNGKAER